MVWLFKYIYVRAEAALNVLLLFVSFYQACLQGAETRFEYPDIQPETMASLSELSGKEITVPRLMSAPFKRFSNSVASLRPV